MNIDPEQVPFPKKNADAILEQSELHNQFLADASNNKMAMKPKLFTEDHKWDKWVKEFEEHLTLLPGSTGPPLACVICKRKEPTLSPVATDQINKFGPLSPVAIDQIDRFGPLSLVATDGSIVS